MEPVDRAHLRDPRDTRFTLDRYAPNPALDGLIRRYWVPTWQVPPGEESRQEVLQYPICLIVIAHDYARFYGVVRGLSKTTLTGVGWAFGVMLQPAAGFRLARRSVRQYSDRFVDLTELPELDGAGLIGNVRALMGPDPADTNAHGDAARLMERALAAYLPLDGEDRLINAVVEAVETDPSLVRVSQLCARFDLTERALQRLTDRRLGLSPKWLLRRRRLHEAVESLKSGAELADLAAALGYADQAHFTRDFKRATGWTPGRLAARYAGWPAGTWLV